jgi:hypothetical protein
MDQFKKLSTTFSVRFSKYITEQFNALYTKAQEGLPKRMPTESSGAYLVVNMQQSR